MKAQTAYEYLVMLTIGLFIAIYLISLLLEFPRPDIGKGYNKLWETMKPVSILDFGLSGYKPVFRLRNRGYDPVSIATIELERYAILDLGGLTIYPGEESEISYTATVIGDNYCHSVGEHREWRVWINYTIGSTQYTETSEVPLSYVCPSAVSPPITFTYP